ISAVRSRNRSRQLSRPLLLLAVLALVVRLAVVVGTPHFRPATDASDYDRIAVSLADHGQFPASVLDPFGGPTAFRPPLFPLALAAVYKLVGTSSPTARVAAGRVLEAVLGAVVVLLVYLIASLIWGGGIALLAAAI